MHLVRTLEDVRGLGFGYNARPDLHSVSLADVGTTFDKWSKDSILYNVFGDYRDGNLHLRFDPLSLLFFNEKNLKKLLLTRVDSGSENSETGVDTYVINYPLLTSLDEETVFFLSLKLSNWDISISC